MTTVWFYRFPEEMPRYVPLFCRNERDARAFVRRHYKIKRVPQDTQFWTVETDEFKDLSGSEAYKLNRLLNEIGCGHKVWGKGELMILVGPVTLMFNKQGQFTMMIWSDERGEYNVECREETG